MPPRLDLFPEQEEQGADASGQEPEHARTPLGTWEIREGDCIEVMRGMDDASVDSVVTDPPYGLGFMGKHWDIGIPATEVFAECLRVLKPGGHLLAFGGTRTYHRLVCAIEDAGFEPRDTIMWLHAQGFPKSQDVSKEIDKQAGVEREVTGTDEARKSRFGKAFDGSTSATQIWPSAPRNADITTPATEAAQQWDGWGTALKPAMELVAVCRKPLEGTVAANVQEHGTGALNIDECRVPSEGGAAREGEASQESRYNEHGTTNFAALPGSRGGSPSGRFPANTIHDGSDEVLEAFAAYGERTSGKPGTMRKGTNDSATYGAESRTPGTPMTGFGDTGTAARFFYCAKASKADRTEKGQVKNDHATVKPTELMRYLCRLVTPPNGLVLDPFAGSGSTGKGAVLEGFQFVGIETDAHYCEIARARIKHVCNQ